MAISTQPTATWQCPHCGARQPESGRCWVCHRPSTCCATCANFRPSFVGGLGYCGLDSRRTPLRGTELRGCWEPAAPILPALFDDLAAASPSVTPSAPRRPESSAGGATAVNHGREWVQVDEADAGGTQGSTTH